MRQNARNNIIILLLLSLLFVGCKTKHGAVGTTPLDMESLAFVSTSPSVVSPRTAMSGNVKLSATVNGESFVAKGTMRVKEGNGVQIAVTALGLMEVACLEFLPDNMRFIYKLGKEYTELPYSDIAFLERTGIGYKMLEAVFMNNLFSPDGRSFQQAMKEMSYSKDDDVITVTTKEKNDITYKFYIDKHSGELLQSEGVHVDGIKVICHYSEFSTINGISFPHKILLTLEGVDNNVSLQFTLSKLKFDDVKFTPRHISSSYEKKSAEQLLNSFGNMEKQ